ncbi:hypothetical protein SporoP37_09830 [Sporosarcina sp. P37]|uniref:LuxR C-terminal-related transcriptional regulator n=1 Tax=unclassified Sporosarcina TaxID=2647733 RepID=UPI000A17C142|nr:MULTISPECIES: LuxR C-terminal-related transcriptional regulator [unclassified Sporosarcina]ARK24932.1 hypothetical protein SporoP37_09830 [Sporosarcina sp. P37]PID18072.1 hypothetical protein CSV62_10040 [Sporosarcina sp. P35]
MKESEAAVKVKMPVADENFIIRKEIQIPCHIKMVRLTAIQAPLGYGKTTLLSKSLSRVNGYTAWLALDEMDNDPVRFWSCIIHSIVHSGKAINKEKVLSFLETGPPFYRIVDMLLDELSRKQENISLVLDDYDLISNPVIHKMMARFIHFLPRHVKVFIISQDEIPLPLSEWRIKGWMYEIGIGQLQFTLDEVKEFYENNAVVTPRTKSFYQQVLCAAEGWPFGVRLLSLTEPHKDRQRKSMELSILSPVVGSYVLYEVLSSLPAAVQQFLIRTSLLKELTPAYCNQVMKRDDSEEVLKEIERKGLFISQLEGSPLTYRLHPLFSTALQNEMHRRLSKESIMDVYRITAKLLYERRDYPAAIETAVRGNLFELADRWIVENLVNIFHSKETGSFKHWILMLRKNSFDVHPETLVFYAYMCAVQREMERTVSIVRELDRRHEKSGWRAEADSKDAACMLDILKVYILFLQGRMTEKSISHVLNQVHCHPFPFDSRWNRFSMIYNHFKPQLLQTNLGNGGKLGSFKPLMKLNDQLRNDAYLPRPLAGYSFALQAEIYYEMNVLPKADELIKKAMEYIDGHNDPGLSVPLCILKTKIHLAAKHFTEAQAGLNHAMNSPLNIDWKCILLTMKGLAFIREGAFEKAEMELARSSNVIRRADSGLEFWMLVQARLHMERGNGRKALHYIEQVIRDAKRESRVIPIIEAKVLHSLCLWNSSKKKCAASVLHGALELAAESGYKRIFLDEEALQPVLLHYIKSRKNVEQAEWETVPLVFVQSLTTDHIIRPRTDPKKIKPKLTPREEQLIKAIASGASNKEIAEQLFLSEGTVRVYLSKVYKKLNVCSRAQAILLADDWQ